MTKGEHLEEVGLRYEFVHICFSFLTQNHIVLLQGTGRAVHDMKYKLPLFICCEQGWCAVQVDYWAPGTAALPLSCPTFRFLPPSIPAELNGGFVWKVCKQNWCRLKRAGSSFVALKWTGKSLLLPPSCAGGVQSVLPASGITDLGYSITRVIFRKPWQWLREV